jgi:hypothetical protein
LPVSGSVGPSRTGRRTPSSKMTSTRVLRVSAARPSSIPLKTPSNHWFSPLSFNESEQITTNVLTSYGVVIYSLGTFGLDVFVLTPFLPHVERTLNRGATTNGHRYNSRSRP